MSESEEQQKTVPEAKPIEQDEEEVSYHFFMLIHDY